ncbi:hypothetical protein DM77_2753 [Burkholderia mallei]|nr:hypothetical protein DM77_2753 [Burkholderia mallei]
MNGALIQQATIGWHLVLLTCPLQTGPAGV